MVAVALFVFILLVGNAVKDAIGLLASGRLSWSLFFYLMLILIPRVIPYAFPLGILTGILVTLGRMSANNEILAMKAAGLSYYRLCAPILFLALLGTGLTTYISCYYSPKADVLYRKTISDAVRNDPLRFVQARTFIKDFPGFVIYINERNEKELRDLYIWELDEEQRVKIFIKAESGKFVYDELEESIILTFYKANVELRNSKDPENLQTSSPAVLQYAESSVRLPLSKILGEQSHKTKLSRYTLNELMAEKERLQLAEESPIKVQLAIQKKLAMSFSVLALTLIAIPLGIKASRSETYVNFAIALGLALSYFLIFILLSGLENKIALRPDLLIWLPNILFEGLGFYLIAQANKH